MSLDVLPPSWRRTTLGDVAAPVPNAIVDGPFGSNLKLSDYVEEGVPVLQGKNITNDSFRWVDVRFISHRKAAELKRSSVRLGDVLIVKIGSIGYAAVVDSLNGFEFAIIPANLAKVTPDATKIDVGYLHKWLTSLDAKQYFVGASSKTAQPALSLEKIKNLPVPLPPLSEQRRIAEILDKAGVLRAKRRAVLAQLGSLTQSIFLDMFGDPATNPKRIRKQPLGELIKLKSGDFLPAVGMAESGTYAVLGGNGISGFHDEYKFEVPQIVIGRVGAYCGCIHVSPAKSWITDNALYVSERDPSLLFDYLVHALTHARLNQYASQFGQPLVSGSRLYPVPIMIPPEDAQQEFAARVARSAALKDVNEKSLGHLDALFSSLQHRAFRGEL